MLALAKPRLENGDVVNGSEEESTSETEEMEYKKHSDLTNAVLNRGDLAGSYDLSGSISARNRRREKLPVSNREALLVIKNRILCKCYEVSITQWY